jgi:hypothetical protein
LRSGGEIVAGPDGKLWLATDIAGCPFSPCIPLGAALASMTTDGTSTVHALLDSDSLGIGSVAFGADNNPWMLGIRQVPPEYGYVFVLLRMTSSGTFTAYPMDAPDSPLVSDASGNFWFADFSRGEIIEITVPVDLLFSDRFDLL